MYYLLELICVTFLSLIGYFILKKLRFPAATIVGPLLAIAVVQLTGIEFNIPSGLRNLFSIIFGVHLGLQFTRESVLRLKFIFWPVCLISVLYIGLTLFSGNLLVHISGIDENTAFIAVIPGGLAANGVLAVSYGADLAKVSSFQLMRFLSILMIVPLVTKSIAKHKHPIPQTSNNKIQKVLKSQVVEIKHSLNPLWLFPIGALGSWLFGLIHFPAASMLGATFTIGLLQIAVQKPFVRPPQVYYTTSQLGIGAVIGTSFTLVSLKSIIALAGPLLMITFIFVTSSLILGYLFSKYYKWDFTTGYMAVLPGGLSTMIILADELEADVVIIGSMQLMRLITAVLIIPIIYKWFL